ncbi:MAG: protein phosphatase 2C domain-containing protein [Syntrophorhabdaceae bacterium]|nr:protein phosphatase 2C domain-containing protein [Syntrophorhabdaceae bacterium]
MDIPYGISKDIGFRESMEDHYAIYERPAKGFLSAEVYDGHGGIRAAAIAAEMVTPCFLHLWSEELSKEPEEQRPIHELIRQACIEIDDFIVERGIKSGTALANFYMIHEEFFAFNIGDSRIVIGTEDGASVLTEDHKPDMPNERSRIEAAGGVVIRFGVYRVQGELAMSRAIGDAHLKPYIIAEPYIAEGCLGRENDYVIVACDGIWDVMDAEETIDIARRYKDAQKAADMIVSTAIQYGSTDNKTVIVLDLRGYRNKIKNNKMKIINRIDKAVDFIGLL